MRTHADIIGKGLMRKSADMKWALISVFIMPLVFSGLILGTANMSQAEEAKIMAVEEKELVGTVVYFTPRFAPKVIGVGYDATNTDYSFIIDDDTKVEHKSSLSEIHVGDTVKIKYDELTRKGKGNWSPKERIAKVISFVRAARPKSESDSVPGVLVSD